MKTINVGIIGCGMMGREFGSAVARWCHTTTDVPAPKILGVCDPNPNARTWFEQFPSLKYSVADYGELLDKNDIDVIYCAVPHNMHEQIYCDIIRAKKHLMGEKPFGINYVANAAILKTAEENPDVFVRCSSQHPFYPATYQMVKWIRERKFGRIIEVRAGFNHSSDLDLKKAINWKRMIEINGEYGCMGDLGIHTQHIPFHMGFIPQSVYAKLSNLVKERPDGKGGMAECKTWDNALIVCDTVNPEGDEFPMYLETKRMAPGCTNEWYIEIYGLECSAKFSTNDPNAFYYTQPWGKEQAWCRLNIGYKPQFPTITGPIFEFGFTDTVLQMWIAFFKELDGQNVEFGCFRSDETRLSHLVQTAALESGKNKIIVDLKTFSPKG